MYNISVKSIIMFTVYVFQSLCFPRHGTWHVCQRHDHRLSLERILKNAKAKVLEMSIL